MKILHISHDWYPDGSGGIESYLRDVMVGQRERGDDARLFAGSLHAWPELGLSEEEVLGVPLWRVHRDDAYFDHFAKNWHPGVERLLRGVLDDFQPDVVHVHQWIRLTCNLVEICRDHGVPVVVTLHDLYTSCPRCFRVREDEEACFRPLTLENCVPCVPRFGWETEREVRASIDLYRRQALAELSMTGVVLAASEATAGVICDGTGFDRSRIELAALAYRPRFESGPLSAPELPSPGEPFRFGYWGNLTERKGAHVMLAAFRAALDATDRSAELHLFGSAGPESFESKLRELADGLPVVFHGRFDYPELVDARLHMAVFPMVCFETYGFVLDEAFELGIPAIVTDIGAIPQRAGESALRVPPNDVPAMAAAMGRVLDRPAMRDELLAHLPQPGMSVADHLDLLGDAYRRAGHVDVSGVAAITDAERGNVARLQRESAQGLLYDKFGF